MSTSTPNRSTDHSLNILPTGPIVVLGLGIIGLTTSIRLLEVGYTVHTLASHFPNDPLSPTYASSAAGAHHLSFAADDDARQQRFDRRTFDVLWAEEREQVEGEEGKGLLKVVQREFYARDAEGRGETHLKIYETLPDFKVHDPATLSGPAGTTHAVSFTSLTIEPATYLSTLLTRFLALGGTTHWVPTLPSLSAALPFVPGAQAIINCTGLGARALSDAQDETIHPVRGQVIVLRAPWVREGRTRQVGMLDGGEGGERTYIIPRRSGEVVIGGTREVGDWTPTPRISTTYDIKRRALALCPELVPPSLRLEGREARPEDLDEIVVREVVGLRPARHGGIRLERGEDVVVEEGAGKRRVPVVHNVGHGGAGWQSCWGCAEDVVKLVRAL